MHNFSDFYEGFINGLSVTKKENVYSISDINKRQARKYYWVEMLHEETEKNENDDIINYNAKFFNVLVREDLNIMSVLDPEFDTPLKRRVIEKTLHNNRLLFVLGGV